MSGRGSSARGRVRLVCASARASKCCMYACVQEESGRGVEGAGAGRGGGHVEVGVLGWRDGWMFWVDNGDVDTERL